MQRYSLAYARTVFPCVETDERASSLDVNRV